MSREYQVSRDGENWTNVPGPTFSRREYPWSRWRDVAPWTVSEQPSFASTLPLSEVSDDGVTWRVVPEDGGPVSGKYFRRTNVKGEGWGTDWKRLYEAECTQRVEDLVPLRRDLAAMTGDRDNWKLEAERLSRNYNIDTLQLRASIATVCEERDQAARDLAEARAGQWKHHNALYARIQAALDSGEKSP